MLLPDTREYIHSSGWTFFNLVSLSQNTNVRFYYLLMPYLVAVGAVYLDTILTVPHFPIEDEKLRAVHHEKRRGGNVANTLEVLQQLLCLDKDSPDLILLAVLPARSSSANQQIQSSLDPSIDLTHCLYREQCLEAASSYIIRNLASDTRTIVNYNDLPEMTVNEFSSITERLSDGVKLYHFEGRIPDVTLRCIHFLRDKYPSAKISVEVEKPNRPGLQELAAEADIVFYSKSWARGQGYESTEQCLQAQAKLSKRASYLCCTWGDEGAAVLQLSDMIYCQCPAFTAKQDKVIDTIGAGDTFIAGMLYALECSSKKRSLQETLEFANELAGRKVMQAGFTGLAKNTYD